MSTWPIRHLEPVRARAPGFLADVRAGLGRAGQKSLPPKYFYDELGSLLFEAITRLPEYGLWRAERRLLDAHAGDIAAIARADMVVELGSGTAEKTRIVLAAMLSRAPVAYTAVEISPAAIDGARRALSDLDGLTVRGIARDYLAGLAEALRRRKPGSRALVLFLGSSLGNFEYLAGIRFLHCVRRLLLPGDHLLLGTDLDKPERQLLPAYDDPLGVTAAFNLNLLARMNRELDADFDLAAFRHRARYDRASRNVEMHIESLCDQTVEIGTVEIGTVENGTAESGTGGFAVALAGGERIHTENSHKYTLGELEELARGSGWKRVQQWRDAEWAFAAGLYAV